MPRTTLQHLISHGDSAEEIFFSDVPGQEFIHKLIVSLVFVFGIQRNAGSRMLATFLELSGLSAYVCKGKSSLAQYCKTMENLVIMFGLHEEKKLSEIDRNKIISLLMDETFPANMICLVGMEPESGYILIEELSEDRTADTWLEQITAMMERLGVALIEQVTSDEAKALLKVAKAQGAHHNTDLFHVLQHISKAVSARFAAEIRTARKEVEKMQLDLDNTLEISTLPLEIELTQASLACAEKQLELAQLRSQKYRQARKGISSALHPYNINNGLPQSAEIVTELVAKCFESIKSLAAPYGQKALDKISKAEKLLPVLAQMITHYHEKAEAIIVEHACVEEYDLLKSIIIPGLYLKKNASKIGTAEDRKAAAAIAQSLLDPLIKKTGQFASFGQTRVEHLLKIGKRAVDIFQRSSSPVEGRNSHLNLLQYSRHKLCPRALGALTVVHNFFIKRPDGTTAAERFFGKEPTCLFKFLLENMPKIGWPRKRKKKTISLCPA